MIRRQLTRRGVIVAGISLVVTALITSIISIGYMGRQSKLTSADQPTQATAAKLSASDIKPITNAASIDTAAKQLSAIDAELESDQCVYNLITDLDSITK